MTSKSRLLSLPRIGSGLCALGREWGQRRNSPPSTEDALGFLRFAVGQGIRLFDTAPSYGSSEKRLGQFLRELPADLRRELFLATKFGEHWDVSRNQPFVDHGFDRLIKSLDNSLEILGRIDLLQLHIATKENVLCPDVIKAFEYARSAEVPFIGASVKDLDTATRACESEIYDVLQFPLNLLNQDMMPAIDLARRNSMRMIVNRPLSSGAIADEADGKTKSERMKASFDFLAASCQEMTLLLGTKSVSHLHENLAALQDSRKKSGLSIPPNENGA